MVEAMPRFGGLKSNADFSHGPSVPQYAKATSGEEVDDDKARLGENPAPRITMKPSFDEVWSTATVPVKTRGTGDNPM